MKPLRFAFLSLVLSLPVMACAQSMADYTMTVEEHAVDGVAGMTTYRFYIDMLNPDDFLKSILGLYGKPIELNTEGAGFFNDSAATGGGADGVNPLFLAPPFDAFFPNLAYDSWYTIGIESAPSGDQTAIGAIESSAQPWIGAFDAMSPLAGQDVLIDNYGGSWYILNGSPNGWPDAANQRVLFLQLTTAGVPSGSINCQIFENGNFDLSSEFLLTYHFEGVGLFFPEIFGCSDDSACNYNPEANISDGSCWYADSDGDCYWWDILGCTIEGAVNYNEYATEDDGSCLFAGCTDPAANNYDNQANYDAGCEYSGCMDPIACNYNEAATDDDGSCLYNDYDGDGICNEFEIPGCTFSAACNYNPEATDDDGSCEFYCPGCTDELACNYDSGAIQEDGSCQYPIDIYGLDYVDCDGTCITDTDFDGVCDEEETFGCTDEEACNFLAEATQDDGGCLIPNLEACEICIGTDVVLADADGDGVCDVDEVAGCTDENGCNYDPIATDEDGSCSYPLDICGESYFDCDCACVNDADGDGVCDEAEIAGCQDPIACNYNSDATDPAPCETTSCAGCIYPYACNYDPEAVYSDGSCEFGICAGCTNPAACNFNPTVFEDDGSCQFLDECGVCGGEGPTAGFYCDGTCIDTDGDTVCDVDEAGCTDEAACNYNALVNEDDGSCTYADDCIDCNGECFDLNANQICDCQEILGCLDETACNYDPLANIESGACLYPEPLLGCNGNCLNDVDEDGLCDEEDNCPLDPQNDIDGDGICANEEIYGCPDPSACNYNDGATEDDGSCILVEVAVDSAYTQGFNDGMAAGVESTAAEEFCGEGTVWDSGFELCIPTACFGDFNDDGERGTEDLLQLLAVFGTPCPSEEEALFMCGDSTAYHGYSYPTVQIGDQCWFAENLRTEHYANGDAIPGNLSASEWTSTSSGAQTVFGEGASTVYSGSDDEVANLATYGRLYNWYAVDDARGLCPSSWHVPTDGEWTELTDFLGGWSVAGNSMKSSPSDSPAWNGTNVSGFSALPGGARSGFDGFFNGEGSYGDWWSASPNGTSFAWYRSLGSINGNVDRWYVNTRLGFSVRCVRN